MWQLKLTETLLRNLNEWMNEWMKCYQEDREKSRFQTSNFLSDLRHIGRKELCETFHRWNKNKKSLFRFSSGFQPEFRGTQRFSRFCIGCMTMLCIVLFWTFRFRQMIRNLERFESEKGWKILFSCWILWYILCNCILITNLILFVQLRSSVCDLL